MARTQKRLNKKLLAVIGLMGMAMVVLGIYLVNRYFKDPWPHIEKARAYCEEAKRQAKPGPSTSLQEDDPEQAFDLMLQAVEEDWETNWTKVINEYVRAVNNSGRHKDARIQAWLEMADIYIQKNRYMAAHQVWSEILKVNANHYEAKRKLAELYYETALYTIFEQSLTRQWSQVRDSGDDLIRIDPGDPYGYAIKSHAVLSLARLGAIADIETAWQEVEELALKVLSIQQEDPQKKISSVHSLAYRLQAELVLARAQAQDSEEVLVQADAQAESYLREAIQLNPEEPEAYLNLYDKFILNNRIPRRQQAIQAMEPGPERQAARDQLYEDVEKTIQELDSCIHTTFSHDGRFYAIQAQMMGLIYRDVNELEPIIQAYQKALACSDTEPFWYYSLASQYRFRWEDQLDASEQKDLEESYTYLLRGVYHPVYIIPENESPGPKGNVHARIRIVLMQQLVDVASILSQKDSDPARKEQYLATAKKAYQYLRDKAGADSAMCKMAAGEIAYAEGDSDEAIKQLYQADQMMKSEERSDIRLKRKLFHIFKESGHKTLSANYAMQVWLLNLKPGRDFVEYIEASAAVPDIWGFSQLISITDKVEEEFGVNYRYRDRIQIAKAQVLIQLNRREEARAVLESIPGSQVRVEYLRAELLENIPDRITALSHIAESHPDNETVVRSLIGYYMNLGREDTQYYQMARTWVEKALEIPTSQKLDLVRMQLVLSEEDPSQISAEREEEISEQAIQKAMTGAEKDIALGQFWQYKRGQAIARGQNDLADQCQRKAAEYFAAATQKQPENMDCMQGQFDIALQSEDWPQAEQIIQQLRQNQSPYSMLFEGFLHLYREEWGDAAVQLEKFLLERPISRVARSALAQAYQALGRLDDALKEANLALTYDINNPSTLQLMMQLLHSQNEREALEVGWGKLDIQNIYEIMRIIERLVRLNPDHPNAVPLQAIYYPLWIRYQLGQLEAAQPITPETMKKGLESIFRHQQNVDDMCRTLTEKDPQNIRNWLLWAQVNYQYCLALWEPEEKQKALQKTEQVFLQAIAANPDSTELASKYALFLNENDRFEEAEKVLLGMIKQTSSEGRAEMRMQLGKMYSMYPFMYPKAQEQYDLILQEDAYNRNAAILLARLLQRQQKTEETLQVYQKFRMHKTDPVMMNQEMVMLLNMGRLEEAEELAAQMEREFPQQSKEYLVRGTLALYKTHYSDAVEYADQILEEIQNDRVEINALLLKSKALYYNQKFNEAEDALIQLRAMVPDSSMIGRLLLANVYWAKNEPYRAVQELETAWNLSPDSPGIQTTLLKRLDQLNDWIRLEQIYLDLMKRYPQSAKIYYDAAMAMKRQAQKQILANENMNAQTSYTKAIQWMRKALELSTRFGREVRPVSLAVMDIYVEAGYFYRTINDTGKARTTYQSAMELANRLIVQYPDDPGVFLILAEAHYGLGHRREALQYFEKSLKQVKDDPSQCEVVLNRATRVGTHDDIIVWAKRKVVEWPDWISLRLLIANMYLEKGRLADQIQELEAARLLAKEKSQCITIDKKLAESYIREGHNDKAIQAYRRVLEWSPEDVNALNNLAYLLMGQPGGGAEAVELAKRAYELSPADADIMDTYAETLILQHTPEAYDKAKTILNQAIQAKQREGEEVSPGFYIHLAQTFLGLSRYTEAEEQLDLAEKRLTQGNVWEGVEVIQEKIRDIREKLDQARSNVEP